MTQPASSSTAGDDWTDVGSVCSEESDIEALEAELAAARKAQVSDDDDDNKLTGVDCTKAFTLLNLHAFSVCVEIKERGFGDRLTTEISTRAPLHAQQRCAWLHADGKYQIHRWRPRA